MPAGTAAENTLTENHAAAKTVRTMSKRFGVFVDGIAFVDADSREHAEKKAMDQDWEKLDVTKTSTRTDPE